MREAAAITPDAALDNLAFFVGLRLMGADARRRLRIAIMRHPDVVAPVALEGVVNRLERLDALLDGRREPENLQDRLDIARAELERDRPPFDPAFWAQCVAELIAADFAPEQAVRLIEEVRGRIDASRGAAAADTLREQTKC